MSALLARPVLAVAATGRRPTAARRVPARRPIATTRRVVGPDGEWVPLADIMSEKLTAELEPTYLAVRDDSEKHATHKGLHDGHVGVRSKESHFNITVVSEAFAGMTPIKRHRLVNGILKKEFDDGLHALQLSTKTPAEFEKANAK